MGGTRDAQGLTDNSDLTTSIFAELSHRGILRNGKLVKRPAKRSVKKHALCQFVSALCNKQLRRELQSRDRTAECTASCTAAST